MKRKLIPNPLPLDPNNSATEVRDSREDTFLKLLFQGLSVEQSGIAAGYSPLYSKAAIYSKFNSPRFQDKIREYTIANNALSIPKVCNLYQKTLRVLDKEVSEGNLDNMGKLKHIPTQILQIGKILSQDVAGTVINMVNIESMQTLIQSKVDSTGSDTE